MPILLFFSYRQISALSISNFHSNQSTPGWFNTIDQVMSLNTNIHKFGTKNIFTELSKCNQRKTFKTKFDIRTDKEGINLII